MKSSASLSCKLQELDQLEEGRFLARLAELHDSWQRRLGENRSQPRAEARDPGRGGQSWESPVQPQSRLFVSRLMGAWVFNHPNDLGIPGLQPSEFPSYHLCCGELQLTFG